MAWRSWILLGLDTNGRIAAAVALVVLVAFLPGLAAAPVWSKDEARPALVAREMRETGHWLIPHIGGRPYPDKPPLFPWLVALASVRGVTEWSLRLWSVAAAAATVAATFLIGTRLAGRSAGLVAAAILASSSTFLQWARTGRMESLLVLWMTLAFWSLIGWLESGRRGDALRLGLWVGLGMLTKGPIALLPLAAAVAAMVTTRAWSARRVGDGALALGVAAAFPLAWLAAAATHATFGPYVDAVVATFAREVSTRRSQHGLYALEVVSAGFLPWTLLLPATLVVLARSWRSAWRPLLVPLLWIALVVGVFTLAISPREVYFLPVYPALAVLVAWAWSTAPAPGRRWLLASLVLALAAVAAVGIILAVAPRRVTVHNIAAVRGPALGLVLLGLVAAGGTALAVLWRWQRRQAMPLVLGAVALAVLLLLETQVHTRSVARAFPTRAAAARLAAQLPADAEIVYFDRKLLTALVFYLPRRASEVRNAAAVAALAGQPRVHALVLEPEFAWMREVICLPVRAITGEIIDGTRYLLVDFQGTPPPWCPRTAAAAH